METANLAAQQAPSSPKPTISMQTAAASSMPAIAGQFALDAQSEPGSASGGISGLGAIIGHNQDGAETGGFADLLSSILAAPSSGAMLLANAKSSPTSPTSSAALKAASARAATT